MANVVVKQATQEFSSLRPSSKALSIKQRTFGSQRRCRSSEPAGFRTRFNTPKKASDSCSDFPFASDAELHKMIKEKVDKHFILLRQVFQTLDIFNTGTVTQSEFGEVLSDYCDVALTQLQLTKLVKKVGVNRNGTVSYTRFLEKFKANGSSNEREDGAKSHQNTFSDDFENRLKSKLLGQFSSIVKAMKLFDYNQNGCIQKHELRRILENFCFKMTDSQFEKLWAKYDKQKDGHMLNYTDFLDDLGVQPRKKGFIPQMLNVAQVIAWDERPKWPSSVTKTPTSVPQSPDKNVEQVFKEKFRANYEAIRRAVMILDHRAIGFVPLSEFKKIVVSFTVQMSDRLFHSLLERCGVSVSHRIHYERFLDFYGEARTNILWQPEASKAQEDIFTMLRSHINTNFKSIKDAFLEFDYNKDGKISRSELRRIVEKFCFRLSEEDYAKFMAKVDPQHKGYISYHRFLEIFEQKESKRGHAWLNEKNRPKHVSPPPVMTWSTVEEILRNKIRDNWQSVSKAFIKVDSNKDGFLSRSELRTLLDRYCLPLSDEHFDMLWSLCDENNDGKIAFNEFLHKLGTDIISTDLYGHSTKIAEESEARERFMKLDQHARLDRGPAQISADQALGVFKNYVNQKSSDMRKMFMKFDSNKDGSISRKEFRQVLKSLGLSMIDEEFDKLSAIVGFTNGTLSYHNFIKHFRSGKSFAQYHDPILEPRYDNGHNLPDVLFTAEEAEAQIRMKLQQSFSGLREAFYKFDENHDGFISRGEFRRVLKLFMITLVDEEFDELLNRLHFGNKEMLNYKEFLQRFERRENIDGHLWLMGRSNLRAPKDVGYVSAELADEIMKEKATQQWEDISKAFRNFDEDGNGVVTKKELKKILYRYQLALTQDEFDKLWSRYDTDGNGFVDYREFISKLGVEFSPGDLHGHSTRIIKESYDTMKPDFRNEDQTETQHDKVNVKSHSPEGQRITTLEVEKRLREVVVARLYNFVKAFVEVDVQHNGSVSRSLLHKIINENGFHISDHHLNQIWNIFRQNDDGTIQYNDFLALYTNREDIMRQNSLETPPQLPEKFKARIRSAPSTSARHPTPKANFTPPSENSVPGKSTPSGKMIHRGKLFTPPGSAKEIEGRIREKVYEKWQELEEDFLERDKDSTGVVGLQQFKDVLFDCNIPLTPDEVRLVWRKHDVNNTGSISYMDFLRSFMEDRTHQANDKILFRSKLQPTRIPYSPGVKTDQLLAMTARLRKQVRNDWRSMRRSFRALDHQGNGTCSPLAFRHVLRKYDIELSEEEFYHVCSYYDKNVDGMIPYNKFIGAHLD